MLSFWCALIRPDLGEIDLCLVETMHDGRFGASIVIVAEQESLVSEAV